MKNEEKREDGKMKKTKVTAKKWEENIRKARSYINDYDKARWIIVDLALEVCDISHGGRKEGEYIYTVARFAREIEIDRKTLYWWIGTKRRVLDKLPIKIRDKKYSYNYTDLQDVSLKVGPHASKKEVLCAFMEHMKIDPNVRKFQKYMKYLNSIVYNASRPMHIKDVPEATINEMLKKLILTTNLLRKELELRKNFSGTQREMQRMNIKGEAQKRLSSVGHES